MNCSPGSVESDAQLRDTPEPCYAPEWRWPAFFEIKVYSRHPVMAVVVPRDFHVSVKKNDWVRSYSAGVWRVSSEVPSHFEPRASLKDPKELYDGSLFILKRLVNNKWTKAFAVETAHADFVKPLNKADTKKLESFISQNADILSDFETYDQPLDSILNIGFALKRKTDLTKLRNAVAQELEEEIENGVTCDRILGAIAKTSYAEFCGETPQSATLQFVNFGHEIRRRELIYRKMVGLDF